MAALLGTRVRRFFFPERGVVRPAPYAAVVLTAATLGLLVALAGPPQRVEWATYDAFMRLATRQPESPPNVVVVALDELSFAEIGVPWPWPRGMHARLIESLAAQKPARIVFDIVFEGASRSPEDDARLADAIKAAGNVVLAADRTPIDDSRYSVVQWSEPMTTLAEAAAGVGVVTIPIDADGTLRRGVFSVDGRPSLAAAAFADRPGSMPIDLERPQLVRFNGSPRLGVETVSYYQALDAARLLPPRFFSDKIVFVGRSLTSPAEDEADHHRTPVAVRMAGVEVHASIADAISRNRFVRDPLANPIALVAVCLGLTALVAAAGLVVAPGAALLTVLMLTAAVIAGSYGALAFANVRVPVVAPITAMVIGYAGGAAYRFALTTRERTLIKRAFKNFVAPAIVEQMLADPSRLTLGGEERDVTILFSDLEGFTDLSERMAPSELTHYLAGYFREMVDRLLAEQATLDKLIGDSIMVYFGCPIDDPQHAVRACRAALHMQRAMLALNQRWATLGLPQLRTRIGINSGRVVAGNMGTDTIFNFTVIGDAVNLASRLEGANTEYGTLVIVGENTWSRVSGHFIGRELDWIRVKGKQQPVAIYELAGNHGDADPRRDELFAVFALGLAAYREGRWSAAAAHFDRALVLNPQDGPSQTFAARCSGYLTLGGPVGWDGVHVMQSK